MVMTATVATTRTTRRVNVTESRSDLAADGLGARRAAAGALLVLGTLLVWSATAHNEALTGGDSTAVRHQAPDQHRDRARARWR